tara:strand:- start:21903 stop:22640 length:738 start_codon:yes stop_codon:yes gene_type:complete
MAVNKKHPKKQLEKYSNIFGQIGLILVLFITYVLIEYRTPIEELSIDTKRSQAIEKNATLYHDFFKKEKKQIEKKKKLKKSPVILDEIKKTKEKAIEQTLPGVIKEEPNTFNFNNLKEVDESEDIHSKDDPNKIYDARMYTPVFKGCEGLKVDENRICFENKIKKFVQKKFDVNQGLNPGIYRVFSEFVINKEGNVVGIRIKAPSKGLEKEMNRVIRKLPRFIPGKQGDKPVNVKYILPLAFKVD